MKTPGWTKFPGLPSERGAVTLTGATLDWSLGNTFTRAITSAASCVFANSSDGQTIVYKVSSNGAFAFSWPAAVQWPGGTEPTQTSSGVDVYTLINIGGTVYGSYIQAFS